MNRPSASVAMPAGPPGPPLSTWTRLNVFQRLVRAWDRVHPHNAIHALVLSGPEDWRRWAAAWAPTLSSLGLGRVERRGRYARHVVVAPDAAAAPSGLDARPLESLLTDEMNRPFADGSVLPFRPFLVEADGRLHAGVTYLHWLADSVSIRHILAEWIAHVHDPSRARTSPLVGPSGGYRRYFGPSRATWRPLDAIRGTLAGFAEARRLPRMEAEPFRDLAVRVSVHRAPDGLVDRLPAAARARSATVNDLLLSATVRAAERHLPLRRSQRKRDLAVGTVVDLRPQARRDVSDVFGMFLGFVRHVVPDADLADDERLIACVARRSVEQRRRRDALWSYPYIGLGVVAPHLMSRERWIDSYRRAVPLVGGTSNVNMSRTWAADWHPSPLLDYVRVSPTADMLPLVVCATTLGSRFHVTLTRRRSLVPDAAGAAIAAEILDRLAAWAEGAAPRA